MTEESNVININGNDYEQSDLTDQQKYWISQVQDLQQKRHLSEKPEPVENPLDKLAGTA